MKRFYRVLIQYIGKEESDKQWVDGRIMIFNGDWIKGLTSLLLN